MIIVCVYIFINLIFYLIVSNSAAVEFLTEVFKNTYLPKQTSSQPTMATIGDAQNKVLKNGNLSSKFVSTGSEAAFVCGDPESDIIKLLDPNCSSKLKESYFVEWFTVKFQKFVSQFSQSWPNDYVLANSETHRWLKFKEYPYAAFSEPDLFFCHKAIFKEVNSTSLTRCLNFDSSFPCDRLRGEIPDPSLYDSVVLIDAKLTDSDEAFGELINHVNQLTDFYPFKTFRGILIFLKGLRLIKFFKGVVISEVTALWSDIGIFEFLLEFLKPHTSLEAMFALCSEKLNVSFTHSSFLGVGKDGRVFKVQDLAANSVMSSSTSRGNFRALKILLDNNITVKKFGNQISKMEQLRYLRIF